MDQNIFSIFAGGFPGTVLVRLSYIFQIFFSEHALTLSLVFYNEIFCTDGRESAYCHFKWIYPLIRTPFLNKDTISIRGQISTEVEKDEGRYAKSQILAFLALFNFLSWKNEERKSK